MARREMGFVASVAGACLVMAGILDYTSSWVFWVGGAVVGISGLLTLGTRGALAIALTGAWLLASPYIDWAHQQWNLFAAGLLAVALGFVAGALGARPPAPEFESAREE